MFAAELTHLWPREEWVDSGLGGCNSTTMRMDYVGVLWDGCRSLHYIGLNCHSCLFVFFVFLILAVAILACGGSVRNQAYSRMPLNVMSNDMYG